MNAYPAPQGFIAHALPGGCAWFRPNLEKLFRSAWQKDARGLRFSERIRRNPESRHHAGRAPVYSAPFAGAGTLVVRPCVHGGWWGRWARDLYLGPSRARREILSAARLDQMKISTPRLEAVFFYPASPFIRMEVVTRLIPDSQDLVQHLASRPGPGKRHRLFAAVRKLLAQLHRHGVVHPDLNARNILISGSGAPAAWLLDVDAVRFVTPGAPEVDTANRNRLLRSLLKRARLGELGWSESEVGGLWRELFPKR